MKIMMMVMIIRAYVVIVLSTTITTEANSFSKLIIKISNTSSLFDNPFMQITYNNNNKSYTTIA